MTDPNPFFDGTPCDSAFEQHRRREAQHQREELDRMNQAIDDFLKTQSRDQLELLKELCAKQDERQWPPLGKIIREANPATSPRIRAFIYANCLAPRSLTSSQDHQ